MTTQPNPDVLATTAEPCDRPAPRRGTAQAQAYLDLWEIHLALVAVEGPVSRPPAPRR